MAAAGAEGASVRIAAEIAKVDRGKKSIGEEVDAKKAEVAQKMVKGMALTDRSTNFWAAKTQASRNRERGAPLHFHAQVQGADRVVIPADEWESATARFKNALVGFVFGTNPFLGRMRGFVKAKWGDEVKVSLLNDGIFLLNFADEERKLEILLGGPWTFDNRPLILQEWSEHEDYKCGSKSKRGAKVEVGTKTTDASMDEWLQGTAYTQSLSSKSKKKK